MASERQLCRCRRWLPSLTPLWRPWAHRSSASPAAPLLAARSGLSKASAAVYDAIKQAAREASSTKCDFVSDSQNSEFNVTS